MATRFASFTGCLMLAVMGAAYATFNVVAAVVGQQLSLSSTSTTLVANAGILGSWLHATNGPFVERFGPRNAVTVGAILWAFGFILMAVAVSDTAPTILRHPGVLAFLNFVGMQGASFATMSALAVVPSLYCEGDRAPMLGALGATFALGQAFISTLYSVVLRDFSLAQHFLAMVMVGLAVMFRGAFAIGDARVGQDNAPPMRQLEQLKTSWAYGTIVVVSLLFFTSNVVQVAGDAKTARGFAAVVLTCAVIAFTAMNTLTKTLSAPTVELIDPVEEKHRNEESEAHSVSELLRSLDFWLMFLAYFCCAGLASALNSVSALLVAALDLSPAQAEYPTPRESTLVATGMIYAFGALARCWGALSYGRFSAWAQKSLGVSKVTLCLLCHCFSFSLFTVLAAELHMRALYVTLPLINFAWGMLYSSSQVAAVELFGARHFGALWGALSSSPCVSTFLFALGIAGRNVDIERESRFYVVQGSRVCLGPGCFEHTLLVFSAFSGLGVLCMATLVIRVAKLVG